jgi:ATP/maltotriose-dependent transcriptional regulator MalT
MGSAPHEQIAAAIAGGHDGRAIELLLQHGERMLVDGRAGELHGWLEALPDSAFASQYRLGLLAAWVHIYQQRYREALARVASAERALQTRIIAHEGAHRGGDLVTRPFDEALAGIAAVKAHLRAVSGELPGSAESVDAMMLPASADHPVWRAEALVVLARTRLLAGDLARGREDLSDAVALAASSGASRARRAEAEARVLLARIAALEGREGDANAELDAVRPDSGLAFAAARIAKARLAAERLDLAAAERLLAEACQVREARDADGATGAPDPMTVLVEGGLVGALVAALRGDHADARAQVDELERALKDADFRWLGELVQASRFRLATLRNDAPLLRRMLQQQSVLRQGGRSIADLEKGLAAAAAHVCIGEGAAGVPQAAALRELAESLGIVPMVHEARLYEGLGLLARDRSQPQGKEAVAAAVGWLAAGDHLAVLAPFLSNAEPLSAARGGDLDDVAARLDDALGTARDALARAGGDAGIPVSNVDASRTESPSDAETAESPTPAITGEAAETA